MFDIWSQSSCKKIFQKVLHCSVLFWSICKFVYQYWNGSAVLLKDGHSLSGAWALFFRRSLFRKGPLQSYTRGDSCSEDYPCTSSNYFQREKKKFLINVDHPNILQDIADRSKICANSAKLHYSSRKCKLHSKWRNLPTGWIAIFWRSQIQAYNFLAEIVLPKSHFEKWKVREWVRISRIQ